MGLDMYLSAEMYYGGWSHFPEEDRAKFTGALEALGIPLDLIDDGSPSFTIKANVGYWRKANAIHGWFVRNVQGGEDTGSDFEVEREQLETLLDCCQRVLATVEFGRNAEIYSRWERPVESIDLDLVNELLPPQEGFFFGTTEVGIDYICDLEDTVTILERCLQAPALNAPRWPARAIFSYSASW